MIRENISNWNYFRHGSDAITLDVGVTAKRLLVDGLDKSGMGLVTSPDGESIILNSKSLSNN